MKSTPGSSIRAKNPGANPTIASTKVHTNSFENITVIQHHTSYDQFTAKKFSKKS
jgi:hypothetical protein